MKPFVLILLILTSLNLNSCAKRLPKKDAYNSNEILSKMNIIHASSSLNSIGLEWKRTEDTRVEGIHIYRGNQTQRPCDFRRIKSINNRYASSFVDTSVSPDHNYSYAFTVFSLGIESSYSSRIDVKMSKSLDAVSLIEAIKIDKNVIKITWLGHENYAIASYILERRIDKEAWRFLANIKGRLMNEYIDTFIPTGHAYEYRIIALSYAKIRTYPSKASQALEIPTQK